MYCCNTIRVSIFRRGGGAPIIMDPTDLVLLSPEDQISFEAPHNYDAPLELLVTPVGINHPKMMPGKTTSSSRVKRQSKDHDKDSWDNQQFVQKIQSVVKGEGGKVPTAKDLKDADINVKDYHMFQLAEMDHVQLGRTVLQRVRVLSQNTAPVPKPTIDNVTPMPTDNSGVLVKNIAIHRFSTLSTEFFRIHCLLMRG